MKNSLDYLKEACPGNWAEISKYPVDKMLQLMDIAIKESYNQALEDAAENASIGYDLEEDDFYVNKDSILKLKK